MIPAFLAVLVLFLFGGEPARAADLQAAHKGCTRQFPCLSIAVTPPQPMLLQSTLPGTIIATIAVSVIPEGTFLGTLKFGLPYGNDSNLFALSGNDLVLAHVLPSGSSVQYVTVVASQ